jgi:hypothetical protein
MKNFDQLLFANVAHRLYKSDGRILYLARVFFLIVTWISISTAYSRLELHLAPVACAFLGLFWILGVILNYAWFTDITFVLSIILAGTGFILDANTFFLLLGFFSAIIFWDLDHFLMIINPFVYVEQLNKLILRHLTALALALALSLILIAFAWQIQVSINLIAALILAGGAILSFRWILSSLHKRLSE